MSGRDEKSWRLLVHGGSGRMIRGELPPATDRAARGALAAALDAGEAVLAAGGAALDAVDAAVRALEDDPVFNAGRGAALTADGRVELDAAVADGAGRRAGAVAGVSATRSPVGLARAVMEDGRHVLLAGPAADRFAESKGLAPAPPGWFETPERRAQLAELLSRGGDAYDLDMKYGTVGAVALDAAGRLAAATSTGGVTGKSWGRVGDSPVIGAGTWADAAVALSCTGTGEHFLRLGASHEVAARVRLAGVPLASALADVLAEVRGLGGTGGAIALGADGTAEWAFTTPGLYRGSAGEGRARRVGIYDDE